MGSGLTEFPDDFRRHVELLLKYFRSAVWAEEYEMSVTFEDQAGDDGGADDATMAEIIVNDVYLFCKVRVTRFLLDRWRAGNHQFVAKCLCHELCHVLTQPLAALALSDVAPSQTQTVRDVVERQTERICRSLMHVFPAQFWTMEHLEKWSNTGNGSVV